MTKIIRIYEEFVDNVAKLSSIMSELTNRVKYWFSNEDSGFQGVNFMDLDTSTTANSPNKTIMFEFNDDKSLYKVMITLSVENLEKCQLNISKYDLVNQFDENPPKQDFQDVDVNDIKEDFIVQKIAKFDEMDENPDKRRIKTKEEPKEPGEEGTPPPGAQTPPGAQAPPAQSGGVPPPAQMGAPAQAPPPAQTPPGLPQGM